MTWSFLASLFCCLIFNFIHKDFFQKFRFYVNHRKNRIRKIIWYTPPYNQIVKNKLGQKFLPLILKHFFRDSKLSKISNKNTQQLSCNCTENLEMIIKKHNANMLSKHLEQNHKI